MFSFDLKLTIVFALFSDAAKLREKQAVGILFDH